PDIQKLLLRFNSISESSAIPEENEMDSTLYTSGWFKKDPDGRWIAREAKFSSHSSNDGIVAIKGHIPPGIFNEIYENKLRIVFSNGSEIIKDILFTKDNIGNGDIKVKLDVPKNSDLNLTIK